MGHESINFNDMFSPYSFEYGSTVSHGNSDYSSLDLFNNSGDFSFNNIGINNPYSFSNYSGMDIFNTTYTSPLGLDVFNTGLNFDYQSFMTSFNEQQSSFNDLIGYIRSMKSEKTFENSFNDWFDNINLNKNTFNPDKIKVRRGDNKANQGKLFVEIPEGKNFTRANINYIKNLTPEMQKNTVLLLLKAQKEGIPVTIRDGFRTEADQEYLRKTRPKFAAKGRSAHQDGIAIDIDTSAWKDKRREYSEILGNYWKNELGLRWGGDFSNNEIWHFDMRNV